MSKNNMRKNVGFTLIELLVSLAIIGMISSIAVLSISNVKMKQRDAQRMSHMKEIAKALNLYQNQAGTYPSYEGLVTGSDDMSQALESQNTIAAVPTDPLYTSPTSAYAYKYESDGTDFLITFCLETDSIIGYNPGCENTIKP
ncbi:prepilin-type N-terminal cleavage/methylation domain-containing protein [Candidatus Parcubacteria bacterium]|nr:MAG: prepilin-type N-terminal cleavage/methylation domain-containing protein [Candidatus Parcubacteria bacterium]